MRFLPPVATFTFLALSMRATAADDVASAEEADAWIAQRVVELNEYRVSVHCDGGEVTPNLIEQPLLNWSNPLRNAGRGALFVWTLEGNPQLFCCTFPDSNQGKMVHEIQSLADAPVTWTHPQLGNWRFEPPTAGEPIPEAPPPAKSRSGRLIQMRKLSSRFAVQVAHPELMTVRQLPQPVFRYPPDDEVDGAIFAFVQGTDPECLLVLETSAHRWICRVARMTSVRMIVSRDDHLLREFTPSWEVRDPSYRNFSIDAK